MGRVPCKAGPGGTWGPRRCASGSNGSRYHRRLGSPQASRPLQCLEGRTQGGLALDKSGGTSLLGEARRPCPLSLHTEPQGLLHSTASSTQRLLRTQMGGGGPEEESDCPPCPETQPRLGQAGLLQGASALGSRGEWRAPRPLTPAWKAPKTARLTPADLHLSLQ